MSWYQTLSPYLFKLDPENAHALAEWGLRYVAPLPLVQDTIARACCVVDEALQMEVAGLRFYNPVGLAAGFDKNATMIKGLSALGFGFLELGTITQAPQEGNPKPRIFRFTKEQSLQNAMGFNNQGSLAIARRLKALTPYRIPLGINVGKNKIIAQSDSLKNYENVLLDCLEVGDYYTFNLSSPNTPNLRDLQNVSFVGELFAMARTHTDKPLFLKIAPDMDSDEMLKVVESALKQGASGVIATNTSIDYSLLDGARDSGGISGAAIKERAREVFALLGWAFYGKCALISVGGIDSAQEAYERIKLGASLIQIFSSMIFQGPSVCKRINEGLLECLRQDGLSHLSEAVGIEVGKRGKASKTSKGSRAAKNAESSAKDSTKSRAKGGAKASTKEGIKEGEIDSKPKRTRKSENLTEGAELQAAKTRAKKTSTKQSKESKSKETKKTESRSAESKGAESKKAESKAPKKTSKDSTQASIKTSTKAGKAGRKALKDTPARDSKQDVALAQDVKDSKNARTSNKSSTGGDFAKSQAPSALIPAQDSQTTQDSQAARDSQNAQALADTTAREPQGALDFAPDSKKE